MANFLLSGVSAGANQGLANLVASKRADRMAARENRRYENELMFRIGSAEQARQDRERSFAYQQTRDKAADEQWAKSHGLAEDRNQILGDYYEGQLQLGRDRLNQQPSELEQEKMRAEIERLRAQRRYYDAQARGAGAASVPSVPLATGRNIAQELAGIYGGYYDDEGRAWQNPFTTRDVTGEHILFDKNPLRTDRVLKWDSTDPNERTQKMKLQEIGGDMFDRLVQTYGGNVQAAYQHLDSVLDQMLADEEFGDRVYERIRRSLPPELSGDDDLLSIRNLARDQIRRGALLKHAELIGAATTPNTTGTADDPALNFR